MFGKIAAFELRYQLRQPIFWISAVVFFLMPYIAVATDNLNIGAPGNIHKNAPVAIAYTTATMATIFMFASTAFVANVVTRDEETGFGPLVRSSRLSKFDYLFGRFTGAFGAILLLFLAVPLGNAVGSLMWWIDPDKLGPVMPAAYAYAYFWVALPTIFLVSSLFFAAATVTRSMMATYVAAVAFLAVFLTASVVLSDPERLETAALVDPFGAAALQLVTRYFTAADANTLIPPLGGALLWNRLAWSALGALALAGAYFGYRFEARPGRRAPERREAAAPAPRPGQRPLARPRFNTFTATVQFWEQMRFEVSQTFKSPAFLVLLLLGVFNALGNLLGRGELDGAALYPVTRWVIEVLQGSFVILVWVVAIYYAGELVWRDRERRTQELIDASALPDWALLIPKVVAICLVMLSMMSVAALTGMLVQLGQGFTQIHPDRYLFWYVIPSTIDWSLLAVLAVVVQALSPNKFAGWGVLILILVGRLVLPRLGLDHALYLYGGRPAYPGFNGEPLSDMNGQGDFAAIAAWFRAYWTAFAVLLVALAYALWPRGREARLSTRLRQLPRRLRGGAGVVAGGALVAFVGLGGFIFHNTNIQNEYRTRISDEEWLADYEKAFLKYETLPQPSVTDVQLEVEIYPRAPKLIVEGVYHLINDTGAPVRELHARLDRETKALQMSVNGASKVRTYDRYNYRVFTFDRPLQPGERTVLSFQTAMGQTGFRNSGNMTRVVENGTFVNNYEFGPVVGMDRGRLLQDRTKRKKYGLVPELRPAKLEDLSATRRNYIADADWVNADIRITTDADQTPVAPGYRISDDTRQGRRTIRYRTDAPVLNFFSVQSARYEIRRETYKGVELAIYYDAQHPWNVDKMLASLRTGLDYFQANFSPYQFRQARILEFPGYARFAQAFANTMPYSETIGFVADTTKPDKIDYVTYVTAHELAHQWWAHQIIGADMQGATSLSETLAQYSALIVMEKTYGADGIRKFLKYELDRYLSARGGELVEELPLNRVENQPYIHYRKGSLVMYLLRDRMGEAKVNAALRRLLRQYAFKGAPYPRSQDLIDALRAEAGADPAAQQLITDLFEKITLYDLKTRTAEARRRPDGRYDVTLTVEAKKLYADGAGKETAVALAKDEVFDLGVFTAEPGQPGFGRKDVLAFRPVGLRTGVQTITVTVDKPPKFAGVDPYNKQIDRASDDNAIRVTMR
ncbi:MAG: ABC transporter permease [Phenylobacterium sp.]|uniref:ABC transporter permease/M1 family aminopeptidase n=1 Tax=Phenylobacterium sp. TaxID=1871053 RepID=UPI001A3DB9D6|nr:M1 family aminopeptidase [Phenylobacterium sp.]MBL8774184.1 ABC transporter permease [Phenylobacterium sp.]